MKHTYVEIKIVKYVPVHSSLHISNGFLCTDATELSGEVRITAAEYSRIPGFAFRP